MTTLLMFEIGDAAEGVHHPDASAWREALVNAGVGTYALLNDLRTVRTRTSVWFIPGNLDGESWLRSSAMAIAGVVADVMQRPVPMHLRERITHVESTRRVWSYRIPRLVVTKRSRDWAEFSEATLSEAARAKLCRAIEKGIRADLDAFDALPFALDSDAPFIAIVDDGRPMPIAAIKPARSGHGHAISVLARCEVRFVSHWRIEGERFTGPLQSLGFGRIMRTTVPDVITPELQRALAEIDIEGDDE